ncbi:dephospho-CoA kinase [Parapedobacter tibetensis]|uniref:dephospho-CoA kinase n=1 Tax=Parapedobacter tibetensis TaxID=2972951 RepID=UPI0027E46116|nr:dephospho-CoA kinase [Parapedobacter tibetensis]
MKIGLTGGIGSGKTIISKIFSVLGIPIFDADTEAKRLMATDTTLMQAIQTEFGQAAYCENGSLDRSYMAAQVFGDESKLKKLNALVHPVVIQAGEEWAARQDAPYTIKEAALLFESGSYKHNNYNILVTAPMELRINRVIQRDGTTREQVKARMEQQWSDETKIQLADFELVNDGIQALIPQVLKLHHFFLSNQT